MRLTFRIAALGIGALLAFLVVLGIPFLLMQKRPVDRYLTVHNLSDTRVKVETDADFRGVVAENHAASSYREAHVIEPGSTSRLEAWREAQLASGDFHLLIKTYTMKESEVDGTIIQEIWILGSNACTTGRDCTLAISQAGEVSFMGPPDVNVVTLPGGKGVAR
jgi:hypothetical protein